MMRHTRQYTVAIDDLLADVGAVRGQPMDVPLVDPAATWRAEAACANFAGEDPAGPDLEESGEDLAHLCGGFFVDNQLAVLDAIYVERHLAHPDGLQLAERTLSQKRSAVTSRSNYSKDTKMLSVSRPIDVVVLNDWCKRMLSTDDDIDAVEKTVLSSSMR